MQTAHTPSQPRVAGAGIRRDDGRAAAGGRRATGHRPLRGTERALIGLEGFLAVCGLGGGVYLMTHPLTAMPIRYLQGTWFGTWRWPGIALFAFCGVGPLLALGATLRRMPVAIVGHLCVGIGLVAWIVLEAAWIVVSPPLQVTMGLIGVAILVLVACDLRLARR